MATLFYEPCTRTRLSFESAMKRLGGEVLTTENAREFSSAAKGETLEGYSDIIVMRHFESGATPRAAATASIPVINAGDGPGQHPTQRERFGERIDIYEEARGKYIVDGTVLGVMQKHAVVMHPLPRLDEITVDVDVDPRAAYFRQAKNGLYIRMALLKLLLVGW
ncbi:aspartate carbamoyltransferase [Sarracenia purpurea var. burkii]